MPVVGYEAQLRGADDARGYRASERIKIGKRPFERLAEVGEHPPKEINLFLVEERVLLQRRYHRRRRPLVCRIGATAAGIVLRYREHSHIGDVDALARLLGHGAYAVTASLEEIMAQGLQLSVQRPLK